MSLCKCVRTPTAKRSAEDCQWLQQPAAPCTQELHKLPGPRFVQRWGELILTDYVRLQAESTCGWCQSVFVAPHMQSHITSTFGLVCSRMFMSDSHVASFSVNVWCVCVCASILRIPSHLIIRIGLSGNISRQIFGHGGLCLYMGLRASVLIARWHTTCPTTPQLWGVLRPRMWIAHAVGAGSGPDQNAPWLPVRPHLQALIRNGIKA